MQYSLVNKLTEEEELIRVLELRRIKAISLSHFSVECRDKFTKMVDDLLCEFLFKVHYQLQTGTIVNPIRLSIPSSLLCMGQDMNIIKVNQDIDCPKCFMVVKCLWLSKHLAGCMNPHQSTYSYSSRNSSRIARQRIQEGFKTSYDESKNDSDDEKTKPKKRNNKGRKTKIKAVK